MQHGCCALAQSQLSHIFYRHHSAVYGAVKWQQWVVCHEHRMSICDAQL